MGLVQRLGRRTSDLVREAFRNQRDRDANDQPVRKQAAAKELIELRRLDRAVA